MIEYSKRRFDLKCVDCNFQKLNSGLDFLEKCISEHNPSHSLTINVYFLGHEIRNVLDINR